MPQDKTGTLAAEKAGDVPSLRNCEQNNEKNRSSKWQKVGRFDSGPIAFAREASVEWQAAKVPT